MKRRICLVGVALGAIPLAIGVAGATAARHSTNHAPIKPKPVSVNCAVSNAIMIAPGDTGVTPPVDQGNEYGTASCGDVLGQGVESDAFSVPDSGDTVGFFAMYFKTGSLVGSYDLSPQEGSFGSNFSETQSAGTIVVSGGTGTFKDAKGTGSMICDTTDGIHNSCIEKLTLQPLTTRELRKIPTTTTG